MSQPSQDDGLQTPSRIGIGVLEKAMAVLNTLSLSESPLPFSALLQAGDLPRATLHRILATLVREGLVRYDAAAKTYQLGFRLLELAHALWSNFDLRLAGQDELQRLHAAIGLPVQLSALDGWHRVVVDAQDGAQAHGARSQMGLRQPLHASAAGRAMLAYMGPAEQARLLEQPGSTQASPKKPPTLASLRGVLDLARARGYAVDEEPAADGTLSIAAPILNSEGKAIGAVSATGDARETDAATIHSLSSEVIRAARTITHSAGGQYMTIAPQPAPGAGQDFDIASVVEAHAMLGEGPIWSPRDGVLVWVDIFRPAVHWYDPASGRDTELALGALASVAVPRASGGLLVATPAGLMALDDGTRRLTPFCHPEADRPGNRYNDGKCDRMGRLWIGTLDLGTAANRGSLYRVTGDARWERMDTGFTISNGLGWSPDSRTMYFTDAARKTIYAYDFDLRAGTLSNRRPFVVLAADDGMPDGLTVDEQGGVWVAVWDAWRISRYSPEGVETLRIRMPVPRPTSCCFGGPDLDTLYVTSGSVRLDQEALNAAPQSGNLFALRIPGVRGLPETMFAG